MDSLLTKIVSSLTGTATWRVCAADLNVHFMMSVDSTVYLVKALGALVQVAAAYIVPHDRQLIFQ